MYRYSKEDREIIALTRKKNKDKRSEGIAGGNPRSQWKRVKGAPDVPG
jgi:hypothetical protein